MATSPERNLGFLRLTRSSISEYDQALAAAFEQLRKTSLRHLKKRARIMGKIGALLLADPSRLAEAEDTLSNCLTLVEKMDHKRLYVANKIRYATALQYQGKHGQAVNEFVETIDYISRNRIRGYTDFALQHLGKCYAEMGKGEEALRCFQKALRIRKLRNNRDLVESTQEALSALSSIK